MISFNGILCDGRTTLAVPVRVDASGDDISIADGTAIAHIAHIARADIAADAPIPGVPRLLRLPGGEAIQTSDHAAVAALWPERGFANRAAQALESRWWPSVAGLVVTAACVWLIVAFVLPEAAEPVARRVSPDLERFLGKQTLASLDHTFLKPSRLSNEEQDTWSERFDRFVAGENGEERYAIVFRRGGTPNAMALPGGTIVVTDEMISAAANENEVYAVVAHEIGHVRGRHALRLVLQDSGIAVLVTALAGDAVGVTFLAAALPSVLLQTRYSRQFEAEADAYAFAHMKRHGVSPQAFADLMRRLDAAEKTAHGNDDAVSRYLGSHPLTEERIRHAEEAR